MNDSMLNCLDTRAPKHSVNVHLVVREVMDPSAVANVAYGSINGRLFRAFCVGGARWVKGDWQVAIDRTLSPAEQRAIIHGIKKFEARKSKYQTNALVTR